MYFDHKINRPSATLTSFCSSFFVVVVCDFFHRQKLAKNLITCCSTKGSCHLSNASSLRSKFYCCFAQPNTYGKKKTSWNKCFDNPAISLETKQTLIVGFKIALTVFFGQGCNCVLLQDFCWYLWYSPLQKRMNEEKYWSNHKHESWMKIGRRSHKVLLRNPWEWLGGIGIGPAGTDRSPIRSVVCGRILE